MGYTGVENDMKTHERCTNLLDPSEAARLSQHGYTHIHNQ
jgi:hypothetical protein